MITAATKDKVAKLTKDLYDSGAMDDLLDLHVIDCIKRITTVVEALISTCVIGSIVSLIVTLIVNWKISWLAIVYWVCAVLAIYGVDMLLEYLVANGHLCKRPRIDFIIAKTETSVIDEEKVFSDYANYEKENMPIAIFLNVLKQSIPIFDKDCFYIAIKYVGANFIYKIDGNVISSDIYDKIVNGEDISNILKPNNEEYSE